MENSKKSIKEKLNFLKRKNAKLKNTSFFRRGGYALTLTVIVLALLILVNYLVSVLSKKVTLEYDLSGSNAFSISAENRKYIEAVKDEISITVVGSEATFANDLMNYAMQKGVNGLADYYNQTPHLISKYEDFNSNIKVTYAPLQSSEYAALSQQYPSFKFDYGDILVACDKNGNKRVKHLSFDDMYEKYDPSGYAAYGADYYTVTGNNIESALTSAISYVTATTSHKVALITGHSANDFTAPFITLLSDNNYETEIISEKAVSAISDEFDAIAIMAPSVDFLPTEIDAISTFLDNGGKGGKNLIYFADATCPQLPILDEFLSEWGIEVGSGLLVETNEKAMPSNDKSAIISMPDSSVSDITKNMNGFITGFNVPLKSVESTDSDVVSLELTKTLDSVACVPVQDFQKDEDYSDQELSKYAGSILAKRQGSEKTSYVIAFGSVEYISSTWAENTSVANKELVLALTDHICGISDTDIKFVAKSMKNESFSNEVTDSKSNVVRNIFMIIIPLITVACGVFVFIKRRNA